MYYKKSEKVDNCVYQKRKSLGQTQEEVAGAVGVTRQTIISIEKGDYIPSVLLALKLAEHFNCKLEELFNLCPD
ncbi:helix-turn-helix transcriptional regulator [Candidatus Dojkabacteria bacterium]|uniref:Helix-turn-helix transcriptional regulator n=1 Tax=Candidatus Dojkabacteria bacterium TaxID=2099670 RepID=A0A955I5P8_9BACT|nr:helix-turn-helix transcriptional regulator [Candidatus Dojkabacteria bacterium]